MYFIYSNHQKSSKYMHISDYMTFCFSRQSHKTNGLEGLYSLGPANLGRRNSLLDKVLKLSIVACSVFKHYDISTANYVGREKLSDPNSVTSIFSSFFNLFSPTSCPSAISSLLLFWLGFISFASYIRSHYVEILGLILVMMCTRSLNSCLTIENIEVTDMNYHNRVVC